MSQEICFFYSQDRQRRIALFRREEGSFGFVEQYHFNKEAAGIEGWASYAPSPSFYADLEIAKEEAVLGIQWAASDDGFIAADPAV
ncbi:hypothetical protein [Variovorax paradoxus]|uniref:hypothetical protein n=1 Tax=Variovorax paradoxus TaxID=34073 RepID=UPI00193319AB|nr:hypothetical protein INQ48_32125 [Variovorax paradoxus]